MYVELTPIDPKDGVSINVNTEAVLYVRRHSSHAEIVFRGGEVVAVTTPPKDLIELLEASALDGTNPNWRVLG